MEVRPATLEDCAAIARGMKVVVDEGRWLATEPSTPVEDLEQRFRFSVESDEHLLFLLEDGAELVGALGLNPTHAPACSRSGCGCCRSGAGAAAAGCSLEAALAARPADVHKIELDVFPDNEPRSASTARSASRRRGCGATTTAARTARCARRWSWRGCSWTEARGLGASVSGEREPDGLLGGLGRRPRPGAPAISSLPRDAQLRRAIDRPAEVAGVADLRERPPLAADRDHRVAAGDDGEVAGVADPAGDDVGAVGVRLLDRDAGHDPDHLAAGPRRAARRRLHHAAAPAADDRHPRLGQQPPNLLGQPPRLRALLAALEPITEI